MKVEEFKIGDIINFNGKKAKVVSLSLEHKDTLKVLPIKENGVEWSWVARASLIDEIDPIPLTSEILEKNGYVHCSDGEDELWIEYEHSFSLEVDSDESLWYCQKKVEFVHELQHILWALGIDDDLKIWY